MSFNIAIDGPAGAGKSTMAKELARRLGYIYVDTGAMYRAMGLFFLRNKVDLMDKDMLDRCLEQVQIRIIHDQGEQNVILNNENVTSIIRSQEVGNMASICAQNLSVREKLVELQQAIAKEADVVMDGRDIGTCVLKNANVKFYLTASVQVRAKRRFLELQEKGENCIVDTIEKEIADRDHRDMTREHSPLVQAEDAVLIDSSFMNQEETIHKMLEYIDQIKE